MTCDKVLIFHETYLIYVIIYVSLLKENSV